MHTRVSDFNEENFLSETKEQVYDVYRVPVTRLKCGVLQSVSDGMDLLPSMTEFNFLQECRGSLTSECNKHSTLIKLNLLQAGRPAFASPLGLSCFTSVIF